MTLNLSPTRSCYNMGLDLLLYLPGQARHWKSLPTYLRSDTSTTFGCHCLPVAFLTFYDFSLHVPKSCHKMTLVTSCHYIPPFLSTCQLTCLDMLDLVTTWVYLLLCLDLCLPREILSAHVHVPPMCLQCVSLISLFVSSCQILSWHGFGSRCPP